MESFLRDWRQAAESRSQYDTAIFVGDKVLALTDSDEDAICLARLHFATGNYSRAQSLLAREGLKEQYPECKYLSANCHVKEGRYDDALTVLGERPPQHLLTVASNGRRKHAKVDSQSRSTQQQIVAPSSQGKQSDDVRFIAAMCHLRGLCYAKQNAFNRAKECYKDAVRIDVQCFEAFDQLMKNSLMSPDEEWAFLSSLDFDAVATSSPAQGSASTAQQAGELVKMLYTTRLSKYKNPEELANAVETLSTHYKLASNPDILLSKASLLFTQCRFREALTLTTSVLENDRYNFAVLPVHLACLHELDEKNALFLLSHDLADRHPEEPATWLAVGVYYLTINKISEARRWFSKASVMDPHFGPAWIGFAHTFAAEGEHDQAISAYSTAARLFQGTHLPSLFLGMQNLQLQNLQLAREYLSTANDLCKTDPLLLNEIGVVHFHEGDLDRAVASFCAAIQLARDASADEGSCLAAHANLGHALRRARRFTEALECFDECIRLSARDPALFAAKAMCLLELAGDALHPDSADLQAHDALLWDAIAALHECLAVNPQDAVGTELLAKALEQSASRSMLRDGLDEESEEIDRLLDEKKAEATAAAAAAAAGGRRRAGGLPVVRAASSAGATAGS